MSFIGVIVVTVNIGQPLLSKIKLLTMSFEASTRLVTINLGLTLFNKCFPLALEKEDELLRVGCCSVDGNSGRYVPDCLIGCNPNAESTLSPSFKLRRRFFVGLTIDWLSLNA